MNDFEIKYSIPIFLQGAIIYSIVTKPVFSDTNVCQNDGDFSGGTNLSFEMREKACLHVLGLFWSYFSVFFYI